MLRDGSEFPPLFVQSFPKNQDGFQSLDGAVNPLVSFEIPPHEDFNQLVFHVSNVAGLEPEVKPEEADIEWNQPKAVTVLLIVFLETDDQLAPEIIGFGFFALSNS